jgi:hypothetical protein
MAGSPSQAYREFRARLGVSITNGASFSGGKGEDFATQKDKSRRSKPRNPKVPRKASQL